MKEERFFYVPDAPQHDALPDEEAVHALRVLRLQTGDKMFLMDGNGNFYHAEVSLASRKQCLYSILETMPQRKSWHGNINLSIAPTKMMERMEWMVEKATEIGFDGITFLNCKFSERQKLRTDRIEKIVIAAMKQSRKPFKPLVTGMTSFNDFIDSHSSGARFIAHCYNEIERKDLFTELQSLPANEDVTMLVGPEGDFSIDEVKYAMSKGFKSISLGNSRLRTETAGLMAVTMAQLVKRL